MEHRRQYMKDTSKKTLKQALIEKCGTEDNDSLFEYFEYILSTVEEEIIDSRRWYDIVHIVKCIVIDGEKRYFEYENLDGDGDSCRYDCGFEIPDIDDIKEVYPIIVTVIKYVSKKEDSI